MPKVLSIALAAALMTGCASNLPVPPAARAELAPTGKLRAGINLSNELFTTKNPSTGELSGVSIDIMRELAARLGVPLQLVVHQTPGDVADAAGANTWDVAILAIAQERAKTITFSPPISEIEATYAVHKDSPLTSPAQVDAPGVRIAASEKAGYELYLTQTIRNATIIRPKGVPASIELFTKRGADAVAGLRPALITSMSKMPDARLLPGRFMTVNHGLTTPRGRPAGDAYLKAFVEEMNTTGFVARSIEQHGVQGLSAVKN